jgi:hypothetical protein
MNMMMRVPGPGRKEERRCCRCPGADLHGRKRRRWVTHPFEAFLFIPCRRSPGQIPSHVLQAASPASLPVRRRAQRERVVEHAAKAT